jgi:hypothetical protein
MRRYLFTLVAGAFLLGGMTAHGAVKPRADEEKVGWIAVKKVTKASRSVRIQFSYATCGATQKQAVSRVVVRRKRRTIVIHVLMKKPMPQYGICPALAQVFERKVRLKGRLGHRSIRDGLNGEVRVTRP